MGGGGDAGVKWMQIWTSLIAQLVKNMSEIWETWVWFLDWEDPLEKGKATHSSIWRIQSMGALSIDPWTMQSMGSQRVRHDWAAFSFTFTFMKRKSKIWLRKCSMLDLISIFQIYVCVCMEDRTSGEILHLYLLICRYNR